MESIISLRVLKLDQYKKWDKTFSFYPNSSYGMRFTASRLSRSGGQVCRWLLSSLAIIFSTRFLNILFFRISFFILSTILLTVLYFSTLNAFPISFKESHLGYQEAGKDPLYKLPNSIQLENDVFACWMLRRDPHHGFHIRLTMAFLTLIRAVPRTIGHSGLHK